MLIAAFYRVVRSLKTQRRFSRMLHETLGEAVHWHSFPAVQQIAITTAQAIAALPPEEPKKGHPDLSTIKRKGAAVILKHIEAAVGDQEKSHEVLQAALRIASLSANDVPAFRLYLAVFWIVHYRVIMTLREAIRSRYVAIHMTCRPRADKADQSIESFAAIPSDVLTHIKLIGSGTKFEFHPDQHVLEVPSGDAYEDLPNKVFLCYQIIVMACNPSCIIKLDDDHRLADQPALMKALKRAAHCATPVQLGVLYRLAFPSANNRGWHIGKCADETYSTRSIEMPTPSTHITGEFGYILNRQALWRAAWAALYYRQWLNLIMYEDVAVSEVAEKTWIEKRHYQMARSISAVSA
jgi:hypothetical protein